MVCVHGRAALRQQMFRPPVLGDAEYREMAGRLLLRALPLILLPDFVTDPIPHLFRELVDQGVQVCVQRILHGGVLFLQLVGQRVIPALVQPDGDVPGVHTPPSFSSPDDTGRSLGAGRGRLGRDGGATRLSRYSRTGAGTVRS